MGIGSLLVTLHRAQRLSTRYLYNRAAFVKFQAWSCRLRLVIAPHKTKEGGEVPPHPPLFCTSLGRGNDAPLPTLRFYGLVTCKLSLPVAGAIGLIVTV